MRLLPACLAALLLMAAAPLTVSGPGGTVQLDDAALAALPATDAKPWAGPALWAVLDKAGVLDPDFHHHVRQTLVATGSDGYAAVLALGEIDPEFAGRPVLLALRRDGTALPLPHLVVPGEKRGGRSVRDVVRLEVR